MWYRWDGFFSCVQLHHYLAQQEITVRWEDNIRLCHAIRIKREIKC